MKKKRKPTAAEKKLNQIRSANRREGYWKAYDEWQQKFAIKIAAIGHDFAEAKHKLDLENGISFEEHESLCRESRVAGYESGLLVGAENARAEIREFYEKQRREYEAALPSPLISNPVLSAWEVICATNSINTRGDS